MIGSSIIPKLYGLDIGRPVNGLISKYAVLSIFRKTSLLFSRSFFVLYLLTILDFQLLGILFAVAYMFEAFTDYPSGVISDRIGYRKVLFVAFLLYGISFIFLNYAITPIELIGVVLLQGFANGQDSGALQSWFDNNYEKIGTVDKDRSKYLKFMNKNTVMTNLIAFIGGVLGGYLAVSVPGGRKTVFLYQGVFMIYLAFIFAITLGNYYEASDMDRGETYWKSLLGGLKFVFTNYKILLLSIGMSAVLIAKSVWLSLIMMPLFYGYTGSDFYLSIVNLIIFGGTSVLILWRTNRMKRNNINRRLPAIKILHGILFFLPMYYLLQRYPLTNSLQLIPVIVIVLLGIISSSFLTFDKVLSYRLLLDIVPNDKRNGFYSFLPTLSLFIAAILNYFAGGYIQENGFGDVILGLMVIEIFGGLLVGLVIIFGIQSIRTVPTYDDDIPYIFDTGLETTLNSINSIRPSPLYIGETAKRMWISLLRTAQSDGSVTEEEIELMIYTMKRMQEYLDEFELSSIDGVLTPKEIENMSKIREKIRSQTMKFAKKSDGISKDEKILLDNIDRILEELDKLEQGSVSNS